MKRAVIKRRIACAVLVAGGLLLVAAANWHLVHVAVRSQPDCVAHVRLGEATGGAGMLGAASSACTPR